MQKNRLSFKIKHNIKKEFLTLQLEDILTPKKIETDDSENEKTFQYCQLRNKKI